MEIGNNIRKFRELRNYTQDYMAQSLDISQSYYNKIENDHTNLTIKMLSDISKVLETHPSILLDFDANNFVNSITNSQFGFRDYVHQAEQSEGLKQSSAHIKTLQNEIAFLKEQITFLQKLIDSK